MTKKQALEARITELREIQKAIAKADNYNSYDIAMALRMAGDGISEAIYQASREYQEYIDNQITFA